MNKKISILILLNILLFTGCGLEKSTIKKYNFLKNQTIKTDNLIKKESKKLNSFKETKKFKIIKNIYNDENLDQYMIIAKKQINFIKNLELKSLDKLIKKDDSDDQTKVLIKLTRLKNDLNKVKENILFPFKRIKKYKEIISKLNKTIPSLNNKIIKVKNNLNKYQKISNNSKKEFPNKKEDIILKDKKLDIIFIKINNTLTILNNQNKLKNKDYSLMIKSVETIEKDLKNFKEIKKIYLKKFNELTLSYSKILIDQKERYFVIIGKTSWDNSSDFNTDKIYLYPIKEVSLKTYKYLIKQTGDIAKIGWFSTKALINEKIWKSFNINETSRQQPGHNDSAVWWIQDLPIKYYHKYLIIKNGIIINI